MTHLLLSLMLLAQASVAQPVDSGYVEGGIRRNIYGPKDKTSRAISMRLYCDLDSNGNVYNKLGIFDVTEPDNIYGQYFSLVEFFREGHSFILDDRTPGHRRYVLTISPAAGVPITFGRPGSDDQISTTKDKLLAVRARHAIDNGTRVSLGSREFIVIQQLGTLPGFIFFKGDLEQRLAAGDTNAAYAEFFVKTMRRTAGGNWQQERGPLLIGEVDGRIYELAMNPQTNQWVIQQR